MENEEKAAQAGSASVAAKPAAKRPRRGAIVGGVIAAVVVVAGIGAFVWHEQPSFCNAICHTPMDGYLETYEAEPGQAATDKWGNQVADASGMLSAAHRTNDSNATCLSCHQPVISEQVSEGLSWASGNYTLMATDGNPAGELTERGTSQLTEARGVAGDEFCLNKDCHNLTREDLTALTEIESDNPAVIIRNPHSWQHGQQACSDCHKAHRASVLTCTQCHADMELPEGWISAQEAKLLPNQA